MTDRALTKAMALELEKLTEVELATFVPTISGLMGTVETEVVQKNVPGHTPFQVERFIMEEVGDQVTPWGAAFQALRELSSRHGSLMQASSSFMKGRGNLKIQMARKQEIEAKIKEIQPVEVPEAKLKLLRLDGQLELTEAKIIDARSQIINAIGQADNAGREMQQFWSLYKEKAPDDYIERFDEYDRREWRARCIMRSYIGKFGYLPAINLDELEIIVAVGVGLRIKGFNEAQAREFCEGLWDEVDIAESFVQFMVNNTAEIRERPRFPVGGQDFVTGNLNESNINLMLALKAEAFLDELTLKEWINEYNVKGSERQLQE